MKNKILLLAAGAWLTTLAAAYYMGTSQTSPEVSSNEADTSDSTNTSRQAGSSNIFTSGSTPRNKSSRSSIMSRSGGSSTSKTSSDSIREISQLSDPLERSRQMLSLIDSMSPDQFESVVADFRALGMTRDRMSEYDMLLHAWGKVDPIGAITYSKANSNGHAEKEVLASWASNDPDAALAWARENHDSDKANPYLVGVIRGLARTNPALATQVLQELPFSEEWTQALRSLAPHIASLGLSGAQQWLNGIEDPKLINSASTYLAAQFSKQDPAMGADWISYIKDDTARASALSMVIDKWTAQDPSAAKTWITTLPYEDQLKAGPKFARSYAKQDANAAADWLDSNASASNYQELLSEFANGATRSNPVLALNYGNEINDKMSRLRTVAHALTTLYEQDKAGAQNWIQNNDVPEKLQSYAKRIVNRK